MLSEANVRMITTIRSCFNNHGTPPIIARKRNGVLPVLKDLKLVDVRSVLRTLAIGLRIPRDRHLGCKISRKEDTQVLGILDVIM